MDWLLNLIPGGSLTALAAAALATLLGAWRIFAAGKSAGVDKQKAKEAEARAEELERIKRASGARPAGSVLDDPNNRDNR